MLHNTRQRNLFFEMLLHQERARANNNRQTISEWLDEVARRQDKPVMIDDDERHMYQTEVPAKPF
jgi:hypothetical protein